MEYNETNEIVKGKKVYKGEYWGKKRRLVKLECFNCSEERMATIPEYTNDSKNFCSKKCSSSYAASKREFYPETKGKISHVNNIKEEAECKNCEEDFPACLDFHHKEPKQKIEAISRMKVKSKYDLEDVKKEIDKCEIICKNCHAKEHSTREN